MAPRLAAKFDRDLGTVRAWLDEELHALAMDVWEAVCPAKRPNAAGRAR